MTSLLSASRTKRTRQQLDKHVIVKVEADLIEPAIAAKGDAAAIGSGNSWLKVEKGEMAPLTQRNMTSGKSSKTPTIGSKRKGFSSGDVDDAVLGMVLQPSALISEDAGQHLNLEDRAKHAMAAETKSNSSNSVCAEEENENDDGNEDSSNESPRKRVGRSPPRWRQVWEALSVMRGPGGVASNAPVDTMGCAELGDAQADPKDFRFQTLVSLMLSSQTRDEITAAAVRNLKRMPGGLTVESVLRNSDATVHECIRAVGFHNRKVIYLKSTAKVLQRDYGGDIPDSLEGLSSLPGVGMKMAQLCMQAAWGKVVGIGVDVHVHRISNRLRWNKTTTPEKTREALEDWLPRPLWSEVNRLLVGHGQKVCNALAPKCEICLLAERGLCPSAKRGLKNKVAAEASAAAEASGALDDVDRLYQMAVGIRSTNFDKHKQMHETIQSTTTASTAAAAAVAAAASTSSSTNTSTTLSSSVPPSAASSSSSPLSSSSSSPSTADPSGSGTG